MAKQGYCPDCRQYYVWERDRPLAACHCPTCDRGLRRTSANRKQPPIHLSPPPVKTRGSAAIVEKHRVALGKRQDQLRRDVPFAGEKVRNLVFDD